jgi:two-component system chemotaxis response regulator CheB
MAEQSSIVVVGASAGGVSALRTLVAAWSGEINSAIFIVQHTAPDGPALLPEILKSTAALPVRHAVDQEPIAHGQIYVAPPDHHLVIAHDQVLVTRGPKEHFARPAIDPLFRSAALTYGSRVIGVILTGRLDDGTHGLWAVKERGGIAVVQDPDEAAYPSMPMNALRYVLVDHCLPVAEIGPLVERLSRERRPTHGDYPMSKELELETKIAKGEHIAPEDILQLGEPSPFSCPDCHGVLTRLKNADIVRFRCYTGHAYSFQSLIDEVSTDLENSMWNAIRSLEESALLLEHFAKHLDNTAQDGNCAAMLRQKSTEAEKRAAIIRQAVMNHERVSFKPPPLDVRTTEDKI